MKSVIELVTAVKFYKKILYCRNQMTCKTSETIKKIDFGWFRSILLELVDVSHLQCRKLKKINGLSKRIENSNTQPSSASWSNKFLYNTPDRYNIGNKNRLVVVPGSVYSDIACNGLNVEPCALSSQITDRIASTSTLFALYILQTTIILAEHPAVFASSAKCLNRSEK